ncbi:ABC transporter ATP-binding protein [Heliomarina baculiformis]|uniref:ABC transporter ATP-binding protein n=1 Tax=Heliomarina baculiformis TaxID=2872036 RepID=UPI001EE241FD|nr:ABC transporter ATP-binding protein [Heliomarina baculiformis]
MAHAAAAIPGTSHAEPFIRIDGLNRHFAGGAGVHDLSLDIPRGSFTTLLGPSGCGKSTTLRLLAGLETPDSGSIRIDGRDVTTLAPSERGLSMVFQSYALFPHLSVKDNIEFGLRVRRVPAGERRARLNEALDLTDLRGFEARKPAQLSGGQRQRVALARAVVAGHPLCLMDEPLSNLDAKLRHSVRQDIRRLQRRLGMTVIYVTHDQTEAMSMADTVVLMRDGRIEQAASPADIYANPTTEFAATFVGSPPIQMMPPLSGEQAPRVGIRAEDLHLVEPKKGLLTVSVTSTEFLGAETYIYVRATEGDDIIVRAPGRVEPAPGTSFDLDWQPEAAHRFDQKGNRLALHRKTLVPAE